MSYREGPMSPLQMLKTVAGICKTNAKMNWDNTGQTPEDEFNIGGIVDHVYERYSKAEDYRENDEDRWLRAYRNYRGIYGPDVQFTEAEKSRVFVKTTKTKHLLPMDKL